MAAYPNTLAITAANSLVNGRGHLYVAPVLKAIIRDLKRYLVCCNKIRGTRLLPVGYANADVADINYSTDFLEYLYSGDKETTVDFWGVSRFADLGTDLRTLTISHSLPIMVGVENPTYKSPAGFGWYVCLCVLECVQCALTSTRSVALRILPYRHFCASMALTQPRSGNWTRPRLCTQTQWPKSFLAGVSTTSWTVRMPTAWWRWTPITKGGSKCVLTSTEK